MTSSRLQPGVVDGKPQSAKLLQSGMKVCIKYFAIEDGILDDPNVININYDNLRIKAKKILELKEKRIIDE